MQITVTLDYQNDADFFFRGVLSHSAAESPSAYVEDLVQAHLRSHRDVRLCPNPSCCLPCYPAVEFPLGRGAAKKPRKARWEVARYCSHCGTHVAV